MTVDSFVDDNILKYLADGKEKKTREILIHMREEYDEFSRSTLWSHLVQLLNAGRLKQRISPDHRHLAFWRLSNPEPYPVVHLWPGASFHEDGFIVLNRAGLAALTNMIDNFNASGREDIEHEAFTCDGEGYGLHLILMEDTDRLALPYTEDYAKEHRKDALYPWEMMKR